MNAGTETNWENLTLSEADLAACKPVAGEGGHVLRALCPFHGSDHQRSLRVTMTSGRFVCFACGAWGYLAEARERWQAEQQRSRAPWRPVGTAEEVPKAKRHDHLPGEKGYFNAAALQAGAGPLWVCEGAFDALALLAAGVPRVVAIFGVQGWRWAWAREVRALVFALDADTAGQQAWRALARAAALRGKQVAVLLVEAYQGYKDASAAWAAGGLAVGAARPVCPGVACRDHAQWCAGPCR